MQNCFCAGAWAKNDGIRDVFRPASREGAANAADRMLDNPNRRAPGLLEGAATPERPRQKAPDPQVNTTDDHLPEHD